ncbi:MAG: type II secretion system F family protein [Gemmatimonadota bacterium]|nr:type II secretion system F family protein [Gemmatimonadota bacterium]
MNRLLNVPPSLVLLVITLIVSIITMVYVALAEADRRKTIDRVTERRAAADLIETLLVTARPSLAARIAAWIGERVPTTLPGRGSTAALQERLLLAGFDTPGAATLYGTSRMLSLIVFPVVGWLLAPSGATGTTLLVVGIAVVVALVAPTATLDRLIARRQERIRRGIPDALDLLVVCVEAGVSLDAAILRVSRDLSGLHRELCYELGQVVRRIGAGIPRDRALQQLPVRTGVEELRTLVASMIQSERLGSSISRVLRINAETLRSRRRQGAEKKAAEAALKMMLPIALFQLPALLIIVVGPAVVELIRQIRGSR